MTDTTRQTQITLHRIGDPQGGPPSRVITPLIRGAYLRAAEYREDAVYTYDGRDRSGRPLTVAWFAKQDAAAPGCDIIALETLGAAR